MKWNALIDEPHREFKGVFSVSMHLFYNLHCQIFPARGMVVIWILLPEEVATNSCGGWEGISAFVS